MARENPETKLTTKMRKAAVAEYGSRLVLFKQHGNEYSRAGVSDLIGCLDGAFFACEVKAPESYPVKGQSSVERAEDEGATTLQKEFIRKVLAANGMGWVAASVDHFMEGLAALDELNRQWCVMCCDETGEPSREGCLIHPEIKKPDHLRSV